MSSRTGIRKRRMSLTSLIDVIFLLLLFFMLTSTFSKFSEVELTAAQGGGAGTSDLPPLFLQLGVDIMTLNGAELRVETLDDVLNEASLGSAERPQTLLVSLGPDVTAQRLTDLLVALRNRRDLGITVLGGA